MTRSSCATCAGPIAPRLASFLVLRGADLTLHAGETVALVAPSGAGKSTLLHLAGLLEKPDGGSVFVEGRDAGALPDAARTAIRRDTIGFVYQFHHLLGEFTALENVVLPQMIAGRSRKMAAERAMALLASFGLEPRAGHLPGKLSGGEQQRVAIARALANATAGAAGRRTDRQPRCRNRVRGVRGTAGDGAARESRGADSHAQSGFGRAHESYRYAA